MKVGGRRITVRNCQACSRDIEDGTAGFLVAALKVGACMMLLSVGAVCTTVGIAQYACRLSNKCKAGMLDKAWEDDPNSDMVVAAGDFQATAHAVTQMAR